MRIHYPFGPARGALGPAARLGTLYDRLFSPWAADDDLIKYMRAIGLADANGVIQMPQKDATGTLNTATRTLTPQESGTTFLVVAPADQVITLPAITAALIGTKYTFIITTAALSGGTGFSLSPAAADFITDSGLTAVVNKDLINSGASDAQGDMVSIVAQTGGWFVKDRRGTWAKEP